jgi:uncharacterized protein (TIGR02996 family)
LLLFTEGEDVTLTRDGTYAALTAACAAAPDDDLPRLVLADWLDDHDQPEPAATIRWWRNDAKPAAVAAWADGHWMGRHWSTAYGLRLAAEELSAHHPVGWRLAVVLAGRLLEADEPGLYEQAELTGDWTAADFRAVVAAVRWVAEARGYGLAVSQDADDKSRRRALSAWAAHLNTPDCPTGRCEWLAYSAAQACRTDPIEAPAYWAALPFTDRGDRVADNLLEAAFVRLYDAVARLPGPG